VFGKKERHQRALVVHQARHATDRWSQYFVLAHIRVTDVILGTHIYSIFGIAPDL
jgi:hypothetical protein